MFARDNWPTSSVLGYSILIRRPYGRDILNFKLNSYQCSNPPQLGSSHRESQIHLEEFILLSSFKPYLMVTPQSLNWQPDLIFQKAFIFLSFTAVLYSQSQRLPPVARLLRETNLSWYKLLYI